MADGHLSEAACLIEQGATYRRRVGLQPLHGQGDPIFTGFKPGAFAIYFGDAPFYHFDLEGRWQRAFVAGTHYLKAFDGSVQSIDRVREGPNLVLKRNTLTQAAASEFDSQVRLMARELTASLNAGTLGRVEPSSPKPSLCHKTTFTNSSSASAAGTPQPGLRIGMYFAAYGPMPFLPPECLNAVVLQATLGQTGQFGSGRARLASHVGVRRTNSVSTPATSRLCGAAGCCKAVHLPGRKRCAAAPGSRCEGVLDRDRRGLPDRGGRREAEP